MLRGANNQVFCKCHRTWYSLGRSPSAKLCSQVLLLLMQTKNINCNFPEHAKVSALTKLPLQTKQQSLPGLLATPATAVT